MCRKMSNRLICSCRLVARPASSPPTGMDITRKVSFLEKSAKLFVVVVGVSGVGLGFDLLWLFAPCMKEHYREVKHNHFGTFEDVEKLILPRPDK